MGYTVTAIGGTLLHFLYEWTGSLLTAPFSGVNESTWEHMKLFFFPAFFFAIFQSFFFKEYKSFWLIKLKGTLLGLALIPAIFYTYNGVIGKSPDWFNIAIFFIAAGLCYLYEGLSFKNYTEPRYSLTTFSVAVFSLIGVLFIVFTFNPPHLAIFLDPISKTYGIQH